MSNFSWDTSLPAMLDQTGPPAGTPAGMQPVAEALEALRAAPMSDELAGEAAAMAEFRQRFGRSRRPDLPRRRRLAPRLGARAAAAAAVIAVTLGCAVAAYAGVLPAPVQRFAHAAIDAPAPGHPASHHPASHHLASHHPASHRPVRGGTPVGPEAAGPPAHGRCTAYEHADPHGRAVAFANLTAAAGGQAEVQAHCSAILRSWAPRHRHGAASRSPDHHSVPRQAGTPGARPD